MTEQREDLRPAETEGLVEIDGSFGEGGGQILRSSLSLSMVTGRPVHLRNVRAGRRKPGLMRQHLTALRAAAEISRAAIEGATVGSTEVLFRPGAIRAGDYSWAIGTAGSTTLVLQTILPALLCADGPSRLSLEGGTHNPQAPPFEFLERCYLPLVERMGPRIKARLDRPGFHPAGGGQITVEIEPAATLRPLRLLDVGPIHHRRATVLLADLPSHIGERELRRVGKRLDWSADELHLLVSQDGHGPGNVVLLEVHREPVTHVESSVGQVGRRAEQVADQAAKRLRAYLESEAPVGPHLADQLLLLLALAGGGSFVTTPLTRHAKTQIEVVRHFLDLEIQAEELTPRRTKITVG